MIEQVLQLAESCHYEKGHSHQVTKLTLQLFDSLASLHKLNDTERLWLESAALLHDIGWIQGRKGHHKTARDIILKAESLPFSEEEKIIIALIARYHRSALPQSDHKYFCDLNPNLQEKVKMLAALLRMADGLDRSHLDLIEGLSCEVSEERILIKVKAKKMLRVEIIVGKRKADLFEDVFKKEVVIEEDKG